MTLRLFYLQVFHISLDFLLLKQSPAFIIASVLKSFHNDIIKFVQPFSARATNYTYSPVEERWQVLHFIRKSSTPQTTLATR